MKRGYSKVLINDVVLPATGTSCYQAALDCLVMQASANERTEAMWHKVIREAGLKLVVGLFSHRASIVLILILHG